MSSLSRVLFLLCSYIFLQTEGLQTDGSRLFRTLWSENPNFEVKLCNLIHKVVSNFRCFSTHLPCEIAEANFVAISMVFLQILIDFPSISIDFLSFSISFRQLQSILINFNQFQSVWFGQKRRNLLANGRWGKQHVTNWWHQWIRLMTTKPEWFKINACQRTGWQKESPMHFPQERESSKGY